ncbi:MAG: hypothetical protein LBM93_09690 [Oscillospiraceae bacterium]|jgi:hypothetical protein|nr:hypothetical protein [Oscillospiraceae bacterium]
MVDPNSPDFIGNVPMFLICDKCFFKRYANTNYDRILTELTKSDIHPYLIGYFFNTLCSMISAYDEDNTNLEVLDTAYKFGKWIEVNTEIDKNYLLLNKLQIKKRKNELTSPKDYNLLITFVQNKNRVLTRLE